MYYPPLKSILFFTLLLSAISLGAQPLESPAPELSHDHHTQGKKLEFIKNENQWHSNIKFSGPLGGLNHVFLEDNAFTYLLYAKEQTEELHDIIKEPQEVREAHMVPGHAYKVHFLNALQPEFTGSDKRSGYNNYFLGNDQTKWASKVPAYHKVVYENIYEDIQLAVYSETGYFKYDFIVAPGANANQIQLLYEGMDDLYLKNDNLVIETSVETIKELQPYAYQMVDGKQQEVFCRYLLTNDVLTFEFPQGYNQELPLVIDPTVVGATLTGTNGSQNFGHTATFDNSGNMYGGGISFGTGYPTTTGAFQENFGGGGTDWAVSKYNPTGSDLIFATYIGGTGSDYPHSTIVDFNGQLCIYGTTASTNFPATSNAVQTSNGGGTDIAIAKLTADGSALVGATYMGGSSNDGNNSSFLNSNYGDTYRGEIVLDDQGNIYIASCTQSSNFPTSPTAFQSTFNNNTSGGLTAQDGVVFKLNSDLSTLFFSTYLGGDDPDICFGLRVDDFGNVYTTGFAGKDNFPMVTGGVQETWPGGEENGYIVKLSSDGSAMIDGTFWGTDDGDEHSYFIDIDEDDQVHIYGTTTGTIDVTPNTYFANLGSRQFLAAFTADLSTLVYSTVIGNGPGGFSPDFVPVAFMVDKCNGIYFSGYQSNTGLPLTPDAVDTNGNNVFYLGVLTPNATDLQFGTYYGDAYHVDGGTSRFDKAGRVYQGVCSCSGSIMNTTPDAWATTQSTFCDIGVFKIDFDIFTVTATALAEPSTSGCAPFTVDFTYTGQDAETIQWWFGTGDSSTVFDPTYTFEDAGTYTIMQVVDAENTCNGTDTFYLQIDVLDGTSTLTDTAFCQGAVDLFLDVSTANATYEWQDGSTGATYQVYATGIYWVDVNISGCTRRDSFNVGSTTPIAVDLGEDLSVCDIFDYTIDANSPYAVSYQWSDGSTNSTLEATANGDYWVVLTDSVGCEASDTISLTFAATPVVDLGPDINLCEGLAADLDATTPGATYEWQDGSTNPTFTVDQEGIYSVIVNVTGCIGEDEVEVEDVPPLPLELGTYETFCDLPFFNLNASTPGAVDYQWTTGQSDSDIDVATSGIYGVTVYDSFGCETTDEVELVFSTTPPIVLIDTTVCPDEIVTFDVSIPNGTYVWQDGTTNPVYTVTETGTYTVIVNNNGCEASEDVFVNYAINPGVEFETTDVDCFYDTDGQIEAVVATGGNSITYEWENGSSDADQYNLAPGDYDVTITNEYNCVYETTLTVGSPPPIVYEMAQDDVECPGDSDGWITINGTDGGIAPYLYGILGEELIDEPILSDLPGGTYEVAVQDANGCIVTETIQIYEPPAVTVDAGENKVIQLGDSVQINGSVAPVTNQVIEWTPYDSLRCTDCIRPFASPTYQTTYTLTVHDSITGCTLRDTMLIIVEKPRNVFIPNAFSPNGDGANDVIFINADESVRKVNYFRIYNRWGELLYSADNFQPNDPNYGYDGKLKGKFLNPQVLVYIAELEFVDDVVKTYQGDVTLIR